MMLQRNNFLKGMVGGFPIVVGYIPIAVAFGLVAVQSHISVIDTLLFSVVVFAGASQFMAVAMIQTGCGIAEIVIATFVLNFRHFIMGLSFSNKLIDIPLRVRSLLSLGLTDETFSVIMMHNDEDSDHSRSSYVAGVILISYISWVGGTLLGTLFHGFIPAYIADRMSLALYAMFIAFLVPSITREKKIVIIVIVTALTNILCSHFFLKGWSLIISILVGGISGAFVLGPVTMDQEIEVEVSECEM